MKRIKTSKGDFMVIDIPMDVVFISQEGFVRFEDGIEYTSLISEKAHRTYKLSEITEEKAIDIVDYPIILEEIQGGGKMCTYYNYKLGRYDYGYSLVDSLESLLKFHNIEITPNTYIFKV